MNFGVFIYERSFVKAAERVIPRSLFNFGKFFGGDRSAVFNDYRVVFGRVFENKGYVVIIAVFFNGKIGGYVRVFYRCAVKQNGCGDGINARRFLIVSAVFNGKNFRQFGNRKIMLFSVIRKRLRNKRYSVRFFG